MVGEIKKDSTVTGEVKVDNQGTIDKAEDGISVGGNKPNETTQPSAPYTLPSMVAVVVVMVNTITTP